ncbi:MAG TPA: hypothetical protein H9870_12380 [Candidatus Corynebacterium avicola]|uniref:Antitoxin FitA-like ribbon-helix-helix domain-containing protein n=1 Tax=Candidatus Corynebacterium avicola TaxID=2838527 RepID=A0A9D1RRW8_9CORY|nr:hypothetical protein [Candidatus Corynebacterium avicola]
MAVNMQIRNVPEDVRDRIAERAAAKGQSIQAYLLDMVEREARFAGNAATFEITSDLRTPITVDDVVDMVRESRDNGAEVDR